ncbi:MAG: cell division protein FtsL [Candidatus Eisenbacteria bacterium]
MKRRTPRRPVGRSVRGEGLKRIATALRLTGGFHPSLHTRGLILWAAALATGIICVWEHVHSTELASGIENLREDREELLAEIGFLKMECAELESRERIEEVASSRLGMRYPSDGEVVWLTSDGRRAWTKSDYVEAGGNDRSGG